MMNEYKKFTSSFLFTSDNIWNRIAIKWGKDLEKIHYAKINLTLFSNTPDTNHSVEGITFLYSV